MIKIRKKNFRIWKMIIIKITIMTILVIMSTMNFILTKIMTHYLFVIRIIIIIFGNFLFIKIFIDQILI
jgi:hypothetical protein